MKCENCNDVHDGTYGSGRFCSKKCACGFSTKNKRAEINQKVSQALTGRESWTSGGFKSGFDPRRKLGNITTEHSNKMNDARLAKLAEWKDSADFDILSLYHKKERVLKEQDGKCLHCGIDEWNGMPITLELDHIDGNTENNARINLRVLCPNRHSQTPTFRRIKKK